jgi:hypothetical protein
VLGTEQACLESSVPFPLIGDSSPVGPDILCGSLGSIGSSDSKCALQLEILREAPESTWIRKESESKIAPWGLSRSRLASVNVISSAISRLRLSLDSFVDEYHCNSRENCDEVHVKEEVT